MGKKKNAGGRPSDYDPKKSPIMAREMAILGATDGELAKGFGVSVRTIYHWKETYPEFLQALKDGKKDADERVEESLFKRATGYSHPDTHVSTFEGNVVMTPIVKHYPPDATSMIFWLKNRRPKEWRDRIEQSHTGSLEVTHQAGKSIVDILRNPQA